MGVFDLTVENAQLVQARGPSAQLTAISAGEGHVIKADAMLVEAVSGAAWVRVQAEKLPSAEHEHGVVKSSRLLVLVENGLGGQQLAVPAGAALQISHRHGNVGNWREVRHGTSKLMAEYWDDDRRKVPAAGRRELQGADVSAGRFAGGL